MVVRDSFYSGVSVGKQDWFQESEEFKGPVRVSPEEAAEIARKFAIERMGWPASVLHLDQPPGEVRPRVAGARGRVADRSARAGARDAARAGDAHVADAEVLRSVGGDAGGVAAAREAGERRGVADLTAAAIGGRGSA